MTLLLLIFFFLLFFDFNVMKREKKVSEWCFYFELIDVYFVLFSLQCPLSLLTSFLPKCVQVYFILSVHLHVVSTFLK